MKKALWNVRNTREWQNYSFMSNKQVYQALMYIKHYKQKSVLWKTVTLTSLQKTKLIATPFNPLNPLSPNIHIQILQTDLHTFP